MGYIDTFETDEAKALAELDSDLQDVARTSAERQAAIGAAQVADLAASDEGRQAREAARLAAIKADAAARTGKRGRPPISDDRRLYREIVEQHDEAPDHFTLAMDAYRNVVEQLKAAGPALDELQDTADEQVKLAKQTVTYLEQAAEAFHEMNDLADHGQGTMARLSGLISFHDSPFANLSAGPRELHDLAKRWRLRLDAETARLGRDPEQELQEQRERRAVGDYRKRLDKAAATFRTTPDGKRLWGEYQRALRLYEEHRTAKPQDDVSVVRKQVQVMLARFYQSAAAVAEIDFYADAVPQVG